MLGAMKKRIFWTLSKLDNRRTIYQRRLTWNDVGSDEEKDILDPSKLDKSGTIDQRRLIWDDVGSDEEKDILDPF